MAGCPYTWFRSFFGKATTSRGLSSDKPADHLHVRVVRDGEERVAVALPAQSARWLIELIPGDVVDKIRREEIPLDEILDGLKSQKVLFQRKIFSMQDSARQVDVWLE